MDSLAKRKSFILILYYLKEKWGGDEETAIPGDCTKAKFIVPFEVNDDLIFIWFK
jgi:hypothetical protein